MLELIKGASNKLRKLIDGLLEYSRCESGLNEKKSKIDLDTLKNEITKLFSYEPGLSIVLRSTITEIYANRTAIDQILINLVANAIKYNDKKITRIEIGVVENDNCYEFYVKDNGPGIEQEDQKKIFGIFEVLTAQDKFGQSGNGIGLATVKKIVERIGGSIKVESELGKGTKFIFTIEN